MGGLTRPVRKWRCHILGDLLAREPIHNVEQNQNYCGVDREAGPSTAIAARDDNSFLSTVMLRLRQGGGGLRAGAVLLVEEELRHGGGGWGREFAVQIYAGF